MATVCITGANRGIGLELTRQFHDRGDHVVAACRATTGGLTEVGAEIVEGVDVTSDQGVAGLVEALAGRRIDVLVNNAGVYSNETLEDCDVDRIRRQFEVNGIGPLRVTVALLRNLGRGSKVAIVSSRMGSVEDNSSGGYYGYRMSKAAVNMVGKSLARDLAGRGVAVALLHPGFVRTQMTDYAGVIEPSESAAGLIARIDELGPTTTGSFWHANGERLPW